MPTESWQDAKRNEHKDERMKYVVADDQPAVVMLIERLLKSARGRIANEIHAVRSSERLFEVLIRSEASANIVILDLAIAGSKRVDLVCALRRRCPTARLIVYTGDESPFLAARVIAEGARGYVFKTSPIQSLMQAIQQVHTDNTFYDPRIDFDRANADPWSSLTPKQQRVCVLILRHGSIGRIAERERKTYDTIWTHWSKAKKALGIHHEAELAKYFYEKGLMHLLHD
jgi:DNA-binding NarL/FixJ family response regulator